MDLKKIVVDLKAERDRLTQAIVILEGREIASVPGSRVAGPTKRTQKAAPRATGTILDRARERFEGWRKTGPPAAPIPEALWALAVEAARAEGVNKAATSLRLNYSRLKKRVKAAGKP